MSETAALPINTGQMNTGPMPSGDHETPGSNEFWEHLRLPHYTHDHPPVANANDVYQSGLSPLDKLAVGITDKVGSMGFFLAILAWTILWTSYNVLASEVHALHWKSFDPFSAFVAYLLISNVIQILLMPLIMVGQNVQGKHTEIRGGTGLPGQPESRKRSHGRSAETWNTTRIWCFSSCATWNAEFPKKSCGQLLPSMRSPRNWKRPSPRRMPPNRML